MIPRFTAASIALSRAVDMTFGELFTLQAYTSLQDVDLPKVTDPSRAPLIVVATWYAQSSSGEPKARGAMQDDNAHAWQSTKPQISIDDLALIWVPKIGDRVQRALDGRVYEISAVLPENERRTVLELTARMR